MHKESYLYFHFLIQNYLSNLFRLLLLYLFHFVD
nr:MAG TPA: hypothetical protein [Caudoviricetes sp.]